MRQDTKVLLGRLGEETFKYYDFESPSADTDVWPMFEALLLDERVVGRVARHAATAPVEPVTPRTAPDAVPEPGHRRPAPRVAVAEVPRRGIFDNYGSATESDDPNETVRTLLDRLAAPGR